MEGILCLSLSGVLIIILKCLSALTSKYLFNVKTVGNCFLSRVITG